MSSFPQKVDGTAQTWSSSGATNVITCTSLAASGGARMGAKSATFNDGTLGNPIEYKVKVSLKAAVAMTAGKLIDIYLAQSSSGTAATDNPGGVTGSDAAFGNVDQAPQLDYAGSLVASNALGTGLQQQSELIVPRKELFISPVVINNGDQALSATGTDFTLTITPVFWKIP